MNTQDKKSLEQTLAKVKNTFCEMDEQPYKHEHTIRESGRIYFETCSGPGCKHCLREDAMLSAERRAELALRHPNAIKKNIYFPELLIVVGVVLVAFALAYISGLF